MGFNITLGILKVMCKGSFTPSEHECDIAYKCVLLVSVQLFTLSGVKYQRKIHIRVRFRLV